MRGLIIYIFAFLSNVYCTEFGLTIIAPCRTMDLPEYEARKKASLAIGDIYGHLNEKGKFPVFHENDRTQENFVIPASWSLMVAASSGFNIRFIIPKNDTMLSTAIKEIKSSTELILDCANAAEVAKYAVMASFFSDERVDHIRKFIIRKFGEKLLKTEVTGYVYGHLSTIADIYEIQTGDFLYISGHPAYDQYSIGYGRGENTFCAGFKSSNPLFIGFGSFFKDGAKTIQQIQENLARDYMDVTTGENLEEVLVKIKQQPLLHRAFLHEQIQRALNPPHGK